MIRRRFIVSVLLLCAPVVARALSIHDLLLSPNEIPASCHIITGVYPAGVRTSMLYDYKRYAGAMPAVLGKTAQSFNCANGRGSLLFFEYASAGDRDQAELFAKPILSREEDISSPLEFHDWSNGFVVVSFKAPPADLVAVLDKKLSGVPTAAPLASGGVQPSHVPPPPMAAPKPVPQHPAQPAMDSEYVMTSPKPPPPPPPPAPPPAAPIAPHTNLNQMTTPQPAAPTSAEPPMDNSHAVHVTQTPAPPKAVTPPVAPATPPPVASLPPTQPARNVMPPDVFVPAPPVHKSAPPAVATPKPAAASVQSLPEVADSVVRNFGDKLDCANPDLKEQGRVVCAVLDDFRNGTKPTLPQSSAEILIGPVYTVDEYGRLIDQHDNVITGADSPGMLSFFALVSANGQQDFEIQTLIDAQKAKKPLPANGTLQSIRAMASKKRFPVVPTGATSVVILPGGARRVYIRKSGDHWVLFGPQGATPDEQIRANVVLAELY